MYIQHLGRYCNLSIWKNARVYRIEEDMWEQDFSPRLWWANMTAPKNRVAQNLMVNSCMFQ